jgi:hypothetical protein
VRGSRPTHGAAAGRRRAEGRTREPRPLDRLLPLLDPLLRHPAAVVEGDHLPRWTPEVRDHANLRVDLRVAFPPTSMSPRRSPGWWRPTSARHRGPDSRPTAVRATGRGGRAGGRGADRAAAREVYTRPIDQQQVAPTTGQGHGGHRIACSRSRSGRATCADKDQVEGDALSRVRRDLRLRKCSRQGRRPRRPTRPWPESIISALVGCDAHPVDDLCPRSVPPEGSSNRNILSIGSRKASLRLRSNGGRRSPPPARG